MIQGKRQNECCCSQSKRFKLNAPMKLHKHIHYTALQASTRTGSSFGLRAACFGQVVHNQAPYLPTGPRNGWNSSAGGMVGIYGVDAKLIIPADRQIAAAAAAGSGTGPPASMDVLNVFDMRMDVYTYC